MEGKRLRKDLPCFPWSLGDVAMGFCRAQLEEALPVCSTTSAQPCGGDTFTCFGMRLLVVS